MTIILGNLLIALSQVLGMIINLAILLVVVRALISWVNPDPYNPIVRFLTASTEPLISPVRKYIRTVYGGIDFAPLLVILLLYFIDLFLIASMYDFGISLKHSITVR